jgi:curved DNA-binding protein
MASYKDYYDVLGVKKDASQDEIRRAFRKAAAKHHPDKNPGDAGAEERFKEINEAYTALSDPEKRKIYDTYGRTGQVPPQGGWTGTQGGGQVWTNVDPSEFAGFSDFFQSLFGGGVGGFSGFEQATGARGRSSDPFADLRRGARPSAPRSVQGDLELDLQHAFRGGEVAITVGGRRVTVTVPAGVRPGAKLRLRGQAPGGGDLLLAVRIKPHPELSLEGDDVRAVARIPDHVAALGGTASVASLAGPIEVTVPPGSSGGRVLRLRGQGWPRKSGGRGDQLVEVRVTVPEHLSDEQKALYRRLREAAQSDAESEAAGEAAGTGAD